MFIEFDSKEEKEHVSELYNMLVSAVRYALNANDISPINIKGLSAKIDEEMLTLIKSDTYKGEVFIPNYELREKIARANYIDTVINAKFFVQTAMYCHINKKHLEDAFYKGGKEYRNKSNTY